MGRRAARAIVGATIVAAACGGRQENAGARDGSAAGESSDASDGAKGGAGAAGTGTGGNGGNGAGAAGAGGGGSGDRDGAAGADGNKSDAGVDVTDTVDASACTLAESEVRARLLVELQKPLDSMFGRYKSGRWAVYRGTATARDNQSVIGEYPDGRLSGSVLAVLRDEQVLTGAGLELRVVSTVGQGWFWVIPLAGADAGAPGSVTGPGYVSMVLPPMTGGGSYGTSAEALPAMATRPPSISFDAHASGQWGSGDPLTVAAQATLDRIPAGQITFADLKVVDVGDELHNFESRGSEWVSKSNSSITVATCAPPGSGFLDKECLFIAPYGAELFVAASNVTIHGFRNVALESGQVCCTHCDVPMGELCSKGYRSQCFR